MPHYSDPARAGKAFDWWEAQPNVPRGGVDLY